MLTDEAMFQSFIFTSFSIKWNAPLGKLADFSGCELNKCINAEGRNTDNTTDSLLIKTASQRYTEGVKGSCSILALQSLLEDGNVYLVCQQDAADATHTHTHTHTRARARAHSLPMNNKDTQSKHSRARSQPLITPCLAQFHPHTLLYSSRRD